MLRLDPETSITATIQLNSSYFICYRIIIIIIQSILKFWFDKLLYAFYLKG